ncbi:hypothetical protein ACIPK7_05355 [Pseudomonas sp. NPDC086581]|uniref:hypothetical protein n=1 Tax=Pseudomonas sp. NPDC086581 TaxID=3364432 RepID=UPI00381F814E
MSNEKKVPVTFVKNWRGYNPEEVASFPAQLAQDLVDAGVATAKGLKAAPKAKKEPEQPEPPADNGTDGDDDDDNNDDKP